LEVLGGNEARVVHIEMMESEPQVIESDCLIFVNASSEELRIINFTIFVKIYLIKEIVKLLFVRNFTGKSLLHLAEKESSSVSCVKSTEGFLETCEVKGCRRAFIFSLETRVSQELQSLLLQLLRGSELFNSSQDLAKVSATISIRLFEKWMVKAFNGR
jgi:hypothetical protein